MKKLLMVLALVASAAMADELTRIEFVTVDNLGHMRGTDVLTSPEFNARVSHTNPSFSNEVLAVQLDTNVVAQIGELKEFFDDVPVGTVGASVGGLLVVLLGAVALLKKRTAHLDNSGFSDDDFAANLFSKSDGSDTELKNSLLQSAIDGRLPIPISVKSAGFTTESYKRFVVNVSGNMTLTLHTPTSGDAEIFECRFNGSSLAADASVQFDASGATATTMDTDCGTVKAGKVALMSAFWNGATWDVNWKVEG